MYQRDESLFKRAEDAGPARPRGRVAAALLFFRAVLAFLRIYGTIPLFMAVKRSPQAVSISGDASNVAPAATQQLTKGGRFGA